MKNNSEKTENSSGKLAANNISSLTQEQATKSNAIEIPSISLPKGGGALKGIDEKFEVNAANGTASFNIPLPITPGRNGFAPSLALSYNSGGGNSPFGLGWSIGYPMIQQKTDKKLPRYQNESEEDIFIFSGAEDLVPFLEKDTINGRFKQKKETTPNGYIVKRYRPRIEGGFSRIEKINHSSYGTYWKVTTRDNMVTIFGRSENARIANPKDKTKIFQWMPEFSYDDKGNWMQYHYKKDTNINSDGTFNTNTDIPNHLHEKNRKSGLAPFTNSYLKKVTYGYKKAYYANPLEPYNPQTPVNNEYFFELVLDYGEHDTLLPTPSEVNNWTYRDDAFSSFRAGFEIRTNRLCKRIFMFHHFKDEKQFVGTPEEENFGENYLVKSLNLEYEPSSINESGQTEVIYLKSIIQNGYIRKPNGSYSKKSLPPVEFTYQKLNWNKTIKTVNKKAIVNAPVGLTNNYQWTDLYGEGVSGILTEQAGSWFYKSNLGDLDESGEVAFTEAKKVAPKPSFNGLSNGVLSLQDLASNGEKQIVVNSPDLKGYFELTHNKNWENFIPFEQIANIDLQDPNTRMIDLNGDGQPELLMTEENVFVWYAADGKRGYLPAEFAHKTFDEEKGPAIVFADQLQTIFLADMAGDGLTDIVRIRNGEICYWANMGYGKFSAKITMDNAPLFDLPDTFNPQHLHLADVSGTGATDIIYLGKNKFKAYINLSGNAWSNAHEIDPFLPIDTNSKLSVIDLLGTGTSCIVWSSDLPSHVNTPMHYIDLMDSKKPHVMIHHKNNMGKETTMEYKSSTHFYLEDKKEGNPWITKLPFAVQVIKKMTIEEKITDVRFTTEYKYHHGYYDHAEREFRGFGMVEQTDSEYYPEWEKNNTTNKLEKSEEHYQPPMLTKTWYHTGAFLDRERILTHFKNEYWHAEYNKQFPDSTLNIIEPELQDAILTEEIKALAGDEYREAIRACKGMTLRQEVFALDAPEVATEEEVKLQMKPYTVVTHNCNIQMLQPRDKNEYGVFIVTQSEAINISYERDETDFRITHTLNTKIDKLGNILESASVVYGRKQAKANADFQLLTNNITDFSEDVLNANTVQKTQLQTAFNQNIVAAKNEQTKTHLIYTQNNFAKYNNGTTIIDDIDLPHTYKLRLPYEAKTYEITGLTSANDLFQLNELSNILGTASEIEYHELATTGVQSRLIEHIKNKYLKNDLTPLDFGFFDTLGIPYEAYQLAYTPELVAKIYSKQDGTELQADGNTVSNSIEAKGRYSNINNKLWIRSGITHFKTNAGESIDNVKKRFFSPLAVEDPFGTITSVIYDTETFTNGTRNNNGYYLYIKTTTDAIDNKIQIDIFNYRTLSPTRMIDINANPSSVLVDELGLVKVLAVEGNGVYADASKNTVNILNSADIIFGIKEYTEIAETNNITQFFGAATQQSTDTNQLKIAGNNLLKQASTRFVYDFDTYKNSTDQNAQFIANGELHKVVPLKPTVTATITREEHYTNNSNILFGFEYSDGAGNVVMVKAQAEPGKAFYMDNGIKKEKNTGTDLRWIGNGRTVLNNKGNPVKQYEPYFSTHFGYENDAQLVETGVTPILYYDAVGRQIKTILPDGTLTKVEFDSWKQLRFDQNDTVLDPDCNWYLRRTDTTRTDFISGPKEQQAAIKAAVHASTPSSVYLDSLGRPILSIDHNGKDANAKNRLYTTFIQMDIEGNAKAVIDARGNTVMAYKYDMLGHRVYQNSMDAGERWILNNLMGNPIHRWDNRDQVFSFTYDTIQRPESTKITGGDGTTPLNHIYERVIYGEGQTNEYQNNLRGQAYSQYDTAGKVQILKYDFKGNPLESTRELCANYKEIPNWIPTNLNNTALFENPIAIYTTHIEYDALNRAINTITPDNSETKPVYNEAGLLQQIRVTQTGVSEKVFVKNIDYDAKGQREKIVYGDKNGNNLATTIYKYDEATFRLIHLKTTKNNGHLLQDLYYTYDPVGNISEIEDKVIPTQFFNNQKIEGKGIYTYDALYQLTEAKGREHAGQAINFGACDNWKDKAFLKTYSAGNDMAWRNYTQKYSYDPVGNILKMNHNASSGNWTRIYSYTSNNNQLTQTQVGGQTYMYSYHPKHGFITSLPHLQTMKWNFKDELQAVAAQKTCTGVDAETTYYVYDASGERIRKVTENHGGGSKKEERIYLGGIEIYKKYTGTHSGLERTTLHIMDDTQRIAMVDTRNAINDTTDKRTVRYQFSNHLGSANLELDDNGNTISYEEYHPYGTTAYQAVNKDIKAAAKRYRYTGMERDDESGLNYHAARYYLPWLGRWLKPDPIGIGDGVNVYRHVRNNPIILIDSFGYKSTKVHEGVSNLVSANPEEYPFSGKGIKILNPDDFSNKKKELVEIYNSLISQDPTKYTGNYYSKLLPDGPIKSNYEAASTTTPDNEVNNKVRWLLQYSHTTLALNSENESDYNDVVQDSRFAYQVHQQAFQIANGVDTIDNGPWWFLSFIDVPKVGIPLIMAPLPIFSYIIYYHNVENEDSFFRAPSLVGLTIYLTNNPETKYDGVIRAIIDTYTWENEHPDITSDNFLKIDEKWALPEE